MNFHPGLKAPPAAAPAPLAPISRSTAVERRRLPAWGGHDLVRRRLVDACVDTWGGCNAWLTPARWLTRGWVCRRAPFIRPPRAAPARFRQNNPVWCIGDERDADALVSNPAPPPLPIFADMIYFYFGTLLTFYKKASLCYFYYYLFIRYRKISRFHILLYFPTYLFLQLLP